MIIFLKKILNFIFYNKVTQKYSKQFINTNQLNTKNIAKNYYVKFLIKNLIIKKIKLKRFKLFYIYLFTLIYEISANSWNLQEQVKIDNHINDIKLIDLFKKLHYLLPTGFIIALSEKKNFFIINKKKKSNKSFKILLTYNKSVNFKNKRSKYNFIILLDNNFKCKILKNKNINYHFKKKISERKINRNKIISLSNLESDVLIKNKNFTKKNYFVYNYKKFTFKNNVARFRNINKFRIYNKNTSSVSQIKDVVIRYHGLVLSNNKLLRESIENSWYDKKIVEQNNVHKYSINRTINSKCIFLSTGTNNLAHFLFESLTKLHYVKKNDQIKVIINDKIAKHIIEILLSYGFKKKQILIKPVSENWKIKELIFPSLSYFELSQDESNFLSNASKKYKFLNKNIYDKIYISRRDATDSRNLINELEVENFMRSEGYKIIWLSKLSLKKKIEILSGAKVIITPLGAGIQNLYFCKNINAKVLLLGTRRYFHQKYFLQLSFFKKIKLYFIESIELTSWSRDYGYLHSSFYLDLKFLKPALKAINYSK